MSFIATTAPDEAEADVAALYARQQAAWGYVPNYAKVFCHRPEVMARWGQLLAELKRPMDARRFELVTFVAALELRNSACAVVHGNKLRAHLNTEAIVALAADRFDSALSEAEQSMLRFARQIVRDAASVTADQVAELKRLGFSDAEVFDIAAVAAGRAFFAKLLDALGVELDSPFLALDAALREPLMVGRAIDPTPCATMPAA